MIFSLALKNLPFKPLESQIIYIESSYNERVNQYILDNLEHLCVYCAMRGYQFCYLPKMFEAGPDENVLFYNAPYAKRDEHPKATGSDLLLRYMSHPGNKELIPPSLIYLSKTTKEKPARGEVIFKGVSITDQDEYPTIEDIFELRLRGIVTELSELEDDYLYESEESRSDEIRFSIGKDRTDYNREIPRDTAHSEREIRKRIDYEMLGGIFCEEEEERPPRPADDTFDKESKKIADDIKRKVQRLRQKGVDTLLLMQYILESEPLSHLRITKDFRIFLPDYDNREIVMTPLPKAVFLLFLKHPEGIIFKHLPDYKDELKQIYNKLKPTESEATLRSIENVCDPFNNSINENCARIREAFVSQFSEHLAKNYFITGKRGEPKKIALPREMVVWDE